VIVGAGPAALSAAETLRNTGYKGYIYLVTKEKGKTINIQNCPMIELC
jgi:thioredoxin reductase